MIDLHRFLENPFDDPGISLAELLDFSSDHLQRMIANSAGGELTPRITATTSALTLVEDCATDDKTRRAVRKARKQVKDAFRKDLSSEIAMVHAATVAKYGPNAPQVTECFPQGRRIFGECTDDQLAQHLQTLKNCVSAHVADLGAPLVATVQGLVAEWNAIHAASESSSGAVTTSQEGKKSARENLQLMLFLNLLKLGEMFPRQPEKMDLYMRQSLLEDEAAEEDEEEEPSPVPPPTP